MADTATANDTTTAPLPAVLGGVAPYLSVQGAIEASKFYQKAFAAKEVTCIPPDEQGRTMHVHLVINGGSVMLSDPYPEHGCGWEKPQGFNLHLQVDDAEAWWKRAVEAGAEGVMPVQKMFWGDLYGQVRDPYGVLWAFGQTPK